MWNVHVISGVGESSGQELGDWFDNDVRDTVTEDLPLGRPRPPRH